MKLVGTALRYFLLSSLSILSSAAPCFLAVPATAATKGSLNSNTASAGNSQAGLTKLEENGCQECHGLDGMGQSQSAGGAGKFARLAGQYPDYMVKQIRDFRSGSRKNDLMTIMAKSIDDLDAADIAAYYASMPKKPGNAAPVTSPLIETGKSLFSLGDAARNILPCGSCHGAEGKGLEVSGQTIPQLAGQDEQYLLRQLQDWRSGDRHNSPDGVMNKMAKSLTDNEIEALTHYISAL